MGVLGNLDVKLNLVATNFNTKLSQASKALSSFATNSASSFRAVNSSAASASDSVSVFAGRFNKGFKDVSRIAQGIIVSQAFYKVTSDIKEASAALADFSMNCEDAQVSFGILLKDSNKAKAMIQYLQDFAADTPFSTEQAIKNARSLLAYGFPASEMNSIMTSLSDAAAASGDTQSFDKIARALGQIRTKGKLAQQEVLQLTEAGIPAFEILQEKLKLTNDQMGQIGRQGITADTAIKALISGMNERYSGAGQALSNTTRGMLNTIKDDLLIIGSEITSGLSSMFKWAITPIRDGLDKVRTIVRDSGLGGLMHAIIPADLMPQVQLLVANLMGLLQSFLRFNLALQPLISALATFGIYLGNMILPIIQIFAQALSMLVQILTSNIPAVRMFVAAIGGLWVASKVVTLLLGLTAAIKGLFIVKVVAQGVLFLAQAISVLSMAIIRNPLIAILGLAAGGLLAVAMNSKKVGNVFTGLGNKINSAFGNDPSKIFQPKMKENVDTADQFNEAIGSSSEKLDDMGDSAKKAADKAKNALMSFDEVFNLPDKDETSSDGSGSGLDDNYDLGDIATPSIPDIDASGAGLELPDWGGTIDTWLNGFVDTFRAKITNTLLGAGIGSLIGGILGGIFAGPQGAKWGAILGAAAGGLIGYFWDGMNDKAKHMIGGAGLGAVIGAVIGTMVGGPAGGAIGAAIGTACGAVVGLFWTMLKDKFGASTANGAVVGAAIGGLIGFALAGPLGAGIGAALGGGLGAVVGNYWTQITEAFKTSSSANGIAIGGVIGAIIGSFIAPGLGTALGAAIGSGLGAVVGLFWDDLVNAYKTSTAAQGATIGALIGGIVGTIIAPGIGTAIGAAVGGSLGGYLGSNWDDVKTTINEWWSELSDGFNGWWSDTLEGFNGWWTNITNGFSDWVSNTKTNISNWWSSTKTGFVNWATDTKSNISKWWSDVSSGFVSWASTTGTKISNWATDTKKTVSTWASDTKASVSDWWSDTKTSIATWAAETSQNLSNWWTTNSEGFVNWCSDVGKNISTWKTDTLNNVKQWATDTKNSFTNWWSENKTGFDSWRNEIGNKLSTWKTDALSKVTSWASEAKTSFTNWWSDTQTGFATWSSDVTTKISNWYTDTTGKFRTWKDEAYSTLSTWWDTTKSGFDGWYTSTIDKISDWASKAVSKLKGAVEKVKDAYNDAKSNMSGDDGSGASVASYDPAPASLVRGIGGHARGGIFNKQHIANFAEGNKAEAIIPLENASAMQPFVDAVASGVTNSLDTVVASLASINATSQGNGPVDDRPIMYVGTLIADDAGLKQLERKMRVITIQENQRRGQN